MELAICSYSFHRLLESGKQDMFKYITDCKELGCTQLDPWDAHLAPLEAAEERWKAQKFNDPVALTKDELAYLDRVKKAAADVHLPFGCIAVDGAHMMEDTLEARQGNRRIAYHWLEVCQVLGARQMRVDAGGPPEMPPEAFKIIVEGFNDVVARGKAKGIEILMENHWGPANIPENVVKIMDSVKGLGLLFDTGNWKKGRQEDGWNMCARYARATHIKTHEFNEKGDEANTDIPKVMHIVMDTGYRGPWGIESGPCDGDEYEGVKKTIALIKRVLNS